MKPLVQNSRSVLALVEHNRHVEIIIVGPWQGFKIIHSPPIVITAALTIVHSIRQKVAYSVCTVCKYCVNTIAIEIPAAANACSPRSWVILNFIRMQCHHPFLEQVVEQLGVARDQLLDVLCREHSLAVLLDCKL